PVAYLTNVIQGLGPVVSTSAEVTTGRLRGAVGTPMAVQAWLPVSVPYRSTMSSEHGIITPWSVGSRALGVDVAVDTMTQAVTRSEIAKDP
ncbi:MAG: hypothetical protein ACRDYY_17690, partial [Acidimicrobiales bacterium]